MLYKKRIEDLERRVAEQFDQIQCLQGKHEWGLEYEPGGMFKACRRLYCHEKVRIEEVKPPPSKDNKNGLSAKRIRNE